jgi:hypothetical protein
MFLARTDRIATVPLHWSLLPASQLCLVTGKGAVTRGDIEAYVAGTIREGAKGFAKLVDMTGCTLALDHDDLETVARQLVQYGWGDRPGPVAIIVDTAFNLDMAVLVKQRVGSRPFRIFTGLTAARAWLESYRDGYAAVEPNGSFPRGDGPQSRVLRAH